MRLHPRPPRRAPRLFGAFLAGLVVVTGLVALGSSPAVATPAPTGLTASSAPIPVLSWDRVEGATDYDVQVSRTADFATTLTSATTVNVQYVPTLELPPAEIWWRVRARVGADRGDWTIGSFVPQQRRAPAPVQPQAGTVFTPPQTPRFSWDPVAGATSYTVQTSLDEAFTDPALVAQRTQRTTAAYLVEYPEVGTYFWRVRADLGSADRTAWSAPVPYQVGAMTSVGRTAPEDVFDKDDLRDVFLTDVVLDWEPRLGAATYQLRIDTDRNFLSVDHQRVGITGTRYSPPAGLPNDDFYWQVRPVDAGGRAAPWPDTPWRFTRAWPDQPRPVHPIGATAPQVPLFYEWEPVEHASSYRVRLYDADRRQLCDSPVTMHTTIRACVPGVAGDYLWRVQAFDDRDHPIGRDAVPTVWPEDFARFSYSPPAASGATLDRGAVVTGQAASTTGTAAYGLGVPLDSCTDVVPDQCDLLRQTPILTWDPVPGATYYRVLFTNDAAGTNVYRPLEKVDVAAPIWTPTASFHDSQAGSAYFWRVLPCDAQGCVDGGVRPRHAFAKESLGPRTLTPGEGATVADDVTLTWSSLLSRLGDPDARTGSDLSTPAGHDAVDYVVQTSLLPSEAGELETQVVEQTTFTSFATTYPEGRIYWRVAARVQGQDGRPQQTAWSGWQSFEKRSPGPTPSLPRDGAALGQDVTLGWAPVAFAQSYDVEVYAGPTLVAGGRTVHSSWSPSDPFPASDAAYTWRVRRVDAAGRAGEWSGPSSFRFEGFTPSATAPAAGEVAPPTGALFSWQPDPRATSYRYERRRPGSTSDLAETVVTRATSWAPVKALAAGTAQWRVVALDVTSKPLGASAWRDVVVVDPPREVTPVTVSGSGKVGTDLRLSAPTFDPAAATTTYQWYRASTETGIASAISGATGESYVLTGSDLDKYVTVRATGRVSGYQPAVSISNAVVGVVGDAPVATAAPQITGTARFDETLTVVPGQWPGSPMLRYQWYRDGVAITGATSPTRRLTATDVGRALHVVETATSPGLPTATAASDPVVPEPGDAPVAPAPTLTPDPATVGDTLTVGPVSWSPSGSYSNAYQWFRDGVEIPGARSKTYRLVAEDGARTVHAVVTSTLAGRRNGTTTSVAVTAAQQPLPQNLVRPSISGTPTAGQYLRADPGSWDVSDPRFTYQWYRDGVAVGSSSTSPSYRLAAADAGRSIQVVVTTVAPGYRAGTAGSLPVTVDRLTSATALSLSATRTAARKRVSATVRVSATGVADLKGAVSLHDGGRLLGSARVEDGSATVRLPRLKVGRHTIRAAYDGSVQVGASSDKVVLTVTRGRR